MKINKSYLRYGILIGFILLLSSSVFAFGVGSAYYKEHPLVLSRGGTTNIIFNLQNREGSSDVNTKIQIIRGSEVIELIDKNDVVFVPINGSIDIDTKVTIPNDAKIGDVYPVELTFTSITESPSGAISLGSSVGRIFDVIVVPTEEEKVEIAERKKINSWIIYSIIGIVLLILLIWFVLKRRKRK